MVISGVVRKAMMIATWFHSNTPETTTLAISSSLPLVQLHRLIQLIRLARMMQLQLHQLHESNQLNQLDRLNQLSHLDQMIQFTQLIHAPGEWTRIVFISTTSGRRV